MNEIDFLKDRPIYKYLRLVETEGAIDYLSIVHFEEEDSWNPDPKYLEVFENYQSDGILLYRIYKSLWFNVLNEEFNYQPWRQARKEVDAINNAIAKEGALKHLSFNFGNKCVVRVESEPLLRSLKEAIIPCLEHVWDVVPDISDKTGKRSTFVAEYIKSLYPFFLYLKEFVFVEKKHKPDTGIRQFIIDYIELNQTPNKKLYPQKDYAPVNENQIYTSHKPNNHPPKCLLISRK